MHELLNALFNRKILYKIHDNDEDCIEYLFKNEGFSFEMKGWGTAFGDYKDRLIDIMQYPENWKVHIHDMEKDGYPYPWSFSYNVTQRST